MRKTIKNEFHVKNMAKYIGNPNKKIIYRSSWELTVMNFFDNHPNVIAWGSECESIPYLNPVKNKWTVYIPDFIVVTEDADGKRHVEMIEIKPLSQTPGYQPPVSKNGKAKRVSKYTVIERIKNEAKWKAAIAFCEKRGIEFRVLTEQSLFGHTTRKGR